jgi:paraquat-inducible protein A
VAALTAGATAAQLGLASCLSCGLLSPAELSQCPRCAARLRLRKRHPLQRTSALLAAAAMSYVPANVLPVLHTTTPNGSEADTIMGGIALLYDSGSWILALIVLVASVMIPIGKIAVLAFLVFVVATRRAADRVHCTRLFRMVEFIGRWSMLDVFVDAFVVSLVQLGALMSVRPGAGVPFFAATAVLTMFAAMAFDPRSLWDAAPAPQAHG